MFPLFHIPKSPNPQRSVIFSSEIDFSEPPNGKGAHSPYLTYHLHNCQNRHSFQHFSYFILMRTRYIHSVLVLFVNTDATVNFRKVRFAFLIHSVLRKNLTNLFMNLGSLFYRNLDNTHQLFMKIQFF